MENLSAESPVVLQKNKYAYQKVLSNLTFWVLIAVIAGVLLGHYFPETAVKMGILGTTFVDIIKLFIGPIIFLTIVLGIVGMDSLVSIGSWQMVLTGSREL